MRANSFYRVARSVSRLVGPAMGGELVGLIGTAAALWFDATTFLRAELCGFTGGGIRKLWFWGMSRIPRREEESLCSGLYLRDKEVL